MSRIAKALLRVVVALCFAQIVPACLYDPEDRCGPGQRLISHNRCECIENHVPSGAAGCVPCGPNSIEQAGKCVCQDGFSQTEEGAACLPSALGAPCDTASQACQSAEFAHCQVVSGTTGYCTIQGCSSSADCPNGFACETTVSPSYCRRPPTGRNQPCDSDGDCAGFDANWCETLQSQSCQVKDCIPADPRSCFEDSECCDLTVVGLPRICVPHGMCPL